MGFKSLAILNSHSVHAIKSSILTSSASSINVSPVFLSTLNTPYKQNHALFPFNIDIATLKMKTMYFLYVPFL